MPRPVCVCCRYGLLVLLLLSPMCGDASAPRILGLTHLHTSVSNQLEAGLATSTSPYKGVLRLRGGKLHPLMYPWLMKLEVPDYYAELAVEKGASTEEIRTAYKRLVLELHPDRTECVIARVCVCS